MALPVPSPAQTPPIAGMDVLMARLPASARATLRWTEPVLRGAFRRLLVEPLTEGLVAAVTETVWTPYRRIFAVLVKTFAETPDVYSEVVDASLTEIETSISTALNDDEDALRFLRLAVAWQRRWLRLIAHVLPLVAADSSAMELSAEDVARMSGAPEGGLTRAFVLLAAAAEGSVRPEDRDRVIELVEVAFMHFSAGVDVLQAVAAEVPSSPFPSESPLEKHERLVSYLAAWGRRARREAERAAAAQEAADEARTLANEGLAEWFASLPEDDWREMIDENALRPVEWVDGVGFVEVSK